MQKHLKNGDEARPARCTATGTADILQHFFIGFYWAINKQTQTLLHFDIKIINKSLAGARGNRRALEER